jgi:hypothetical protein
MTALETQLKKQRYTRSIEATTVKIGMLVPLFFSGWLTYHFVKMVVLGFMHLIP